MRLSELISKVQSVVQDGAWTDVQITTLLNQGYLRVASGQMIAGKYQLTPPLPFLYTVSTVNTNLNSGVVELPDDFNRELVLVVNADDEKIKIINSFIEFTQNYGRALNAGKVFVCSRHGKNLLYRDIPETAETLTVHYYVVPELMSSSSSEPEAIPESLQESLLVSFACKEIFAQIEDGIEGQKINTAYWLNQWNQALYELEIVVGVDGSADHYQDCSYRID